MRKMMMPSLKRGCQGSINCNRTGQNIKSIKICGTQWSCCSNDCLFLNQHAVVTKSGCESKIIENTNEISWNPKYGINNTFLNVIVLILPSTVSFKMTSPFWTAVTIARFPSLTLWGLMCVKDEKQERLCVMCEIAAKAITQPEEAFDENFVSFSVIQESESG